MCLCVCVYVCCVPMYMFARAYAAYAYDKHSGYLIRIVDMLDEERITADLGKVGEHRKTGDTGDCDNDNHQWSVQQQNPMLRAHRHTQKHTNIYIYIYIYIYTYIILFNISNIVNSIFYRR